jgi:hypothetical protein
MDPIVMTLLVRREPQKETDFPYAVQIAFGKELTPGETTRLTSVRLLDRNGIRETMLRSMELYRPQEWKAAALAEQAQYAADFGNPKPWYCVTYSSSTSVYDYPGSGERESNNGQQWRIETLGSDWETEARVRQKCEEGRAVEWNRRMEKWGEDE